MALLQTLTELFERAQHCVTHLEMRDDYGHASPGYRAWLAGEPFDRTDFDAPWVGQVRSMVVRGVSVRRARIISEPVSAYIRYEHHATPYANLAGGEQVKWLPRARAADLALPGCDFWQFDDGLVCFVFQSGDGEPTGYELREDPAVIKLCSSAFEFVWERGIDHKDYQPS